MLRAAWESLWWRLIHEESEELEEGRLQFQMRQRISYFHTAVTECLTETNYRKELLILVHSFMKPSHWATAHRQDIVAARVCGKEGLVTLWKAGSRILCHRTIIFSQFQNVPAITFTTWDVGVLSIQMITGCPWQDPAPKQYTPKWPTSSNSAPHLTFRHVPMVSFY